MRKKNNKLIKNSKTERSNLRQNLHPMLTFFKIFIENQIHIFYS